MRASSRNCREDRLVKLESAYRSYRATFNSPDVKRLFLRFFDVTTVNVHFVEVVARVDPRLGTDIAERCENYLSDRLKRTIEEVDEAIDGAVALMNANGLTEEAEFLQAGLEMSVRVLSPIAREYLKLMEKTDRLIGLLETLRIDGVISSPQCDSRRGNVKWQVKLFAAYARKIAMELRAQARKSDDLAKSAPAVTDQTDQAAQSANDGAEVSAQQVIEITEARLAVRQRGLYGPRDERRDDAEASAASA